MSGTSLALKIGSLVIGLGVFLAIFKKIKGLKKYGIASLFYVIIVSVILALPTLLLYSESSSELKLLIINQIIIIVLGTLHVILSKKMLPWYSTQLFNMQLLFIFCIIIFSYLFLNLSFSFFVSSKVQLVWALSLLWFLVPLLLNQTINKLLEVPQKEYKKWLYPLNSTIDDPSDEEMENPVVISFVFQKNSDSTESTTFRAKAPVGMALGKLFYFFINDYNSRNPESTVSYLNELKEPDEWIFFRLKSKFLRIKTALDPDDSIYNNNIKENDVLVCNRFYINTNIKEDETTK